MVMYGYDRWGRLVLEFFQTPSTTSVIYSGLPNNHEGWNKRAEWTFLKVCCKFNWLIEVKEVQIRGGSQIPFAIIGRWVVKM